MSSIEKSPEQILTIFIALLAYAIAFLAWSCHFFRYKYKTPK